MGLSAGRARFVWLALLVVAVALPGAAVAPDDLTVRVDGDSRGNFSYNPNSGVLSLAGGRMEEGRHFVRITATGPAEPHRFEGLDLQGGVSQIDRDAERGPDFSGSLSFA